jgi:hypothetical protein
MIFFLKWSRLGSLIKLKIAQDKDLKKHDEKTITIQIDLLFKIFGSSVLNITFKYIKDRRPEKMMKKKKVS